MATATWWLSHSTQQRRTWTAQLRGALKPQLAAMMTGPRRWGLMVGAPAIVLFVIFVLNQPDGRLHVAFLDVGHGDAVLLRTPAGRQILIDGGPDPRRTLAALGRQIPFWDHNLDLVILTSPDKERIAGLIPVLERYDVAAVAVGPEVGEGPAYHAWASALSSRSTGTHGLLAAGDVWTFDGGVELRILWPDVETEGPLVCQIIHGKTQILLMGDATTSVEAALVASYGMALRSQVLHVARHGTKTSSSMPLLQAVQPEVAVVTLGGNREPAAHLLARLMEIPLYRTDHHGTVEIISDGEQFRVKTTR